MNHALPRRRLFGILFLAVAALQLILGETLLAGRLGPITTLVYWTLCLAVTCGAIICALLDATRSLAQSRQEQRALIEDTVHEIEDKCVRGEKPRAGPAGKSR